RWYCAVSPARIARSGSGKTPFLILPGGFDGRLNSKQGNAKHAYEPHLEAADQACCGLCPDLSSSSPSISSHRWPAKISSSHNRSNSVRVNRFRGVSTAKESTFGFL